MLDNQIVIADSKSKTLLEDEEVGEIHVSSPSLSSRYWRKPELNRTAFSVEINGRFLAIWVRLWTGVSTFWVGPKSSSSSMARISILPILGKPLKKNIPPLVRPGSTVANQYSATAEAGIALEVRTDDFSEDAELSSDTIRTLISTAHRLETGRVDIMKKGAVPKTKSMRISLYDEWPKQAVVASWKTGSNQLDRQSSQQA
jgi:hypothetical protein